MKFEAEGTGKKIEEAIENALLELQVPREDVDIKIIDQGGFFKKAKVIVSIAEDARAKYQKYEKKAVAEEEKPKEEPKAEESEEAVKPAVKKSRKVITEDEIVKPAKEVKQSLADKAEKPKEKKHTPKSEKVSNCTPKAFLEGLLTIAKKTATINEIVTEDGATILSVTGENMNDFIGHRGDALYAISYLTASFAARDEKVRVDVEGYRERRTETLKTLAVRVAEKVAKTGRYAKLEPMEASERRIIHMVLQENPNVETISKGQEPHRFLMVVPKKGNKPQETEEEVNEEE